jgi:hypothetical protein
MKRRALTVICLATGFSTVTCDPGGGASSEQADDMPRLVEAQDRAVSPDVRAHIEGRRKKMKIVATTTTRRGTTYDWIYPESQIPGGEIATPPPLDNVRGGSETGGPLAAHGELEEEPEARGPPGTVPILHIDLDRIHASGTMQDFSSKYGNASDIPSPLLDEGLPEPQPGDAAAPHPSSSTKAAHPSGTASEKAPR